jgi:hypothetical protein
MIYEIQTCTIRPGKMKEFLSFFTERGARTAGTIKTQGQWRKEKLKFASLFSKLNIKILRPTEISPMK